MWDLGEKIRNVHIPQIQDGSQFFNGEKSNKSACSVQSNMVITDDNYNLFEGTIQAYTGDRKPTDHFIQDSQ
jgi:hypothetical protein